MKHRSTVLLRRALTALAITAAATTPLMANSSANAATTDGVSWAGTAATAASHSQSAPPTANTTGTNRVATAMSPSSSRTDASVQGAFRCLIWERTSENFVGLTAGYSWAWNVVVGPGSSGDRVREIQCLADFWGNGPRALDGVYGADTKASVQLMQSICGLTTDGIVGPNTWRCLRLGSER